MTIQRLSSSATDPGCPSIPLLQNPEAFTVREDILRLSRRIKSGEKEVAERQRRAQEQGAKVASLQDQLEQLQDAQVGGRLGGCCCCCCCLSGQPPAAPAVRTISLLQRCSALPASCLPAIQLPRTDAFLVCLPARLPAFRKC